MVEPDPWNVIEKNHQVTAAQNCVAATNLPNDTASSNANPSTFEDNFLSNESSAVTEKLPDSNEYIQALERKLSKLKNTPNILEQLKARREHCIENLLVGNIDCTYNNADDNHLNEDLESNRRRDLLRYIQPEQPINLGELVTIIHHDQLEQDRKENQSSDDEATK